MLIELLMCKRTDPEYLLFRNRHYIPNNGCHGQQLHYLVIYNRKHIGIISGASAVYGVKSRDQFFGINNKARKAQLNSIVNNVVYRLENAPKNAASQILATWRRRIAVDWESLYGVQVAGFETFVVEDDLDDGRTRNGALYKADNWQALGITAGNTKAHLSSNGSGGLNTAHTRRTVCKKLIFARKVKGASLASEYDSTWRDPVKSRAIQKKRQKMLDADAHRILSDLKQTSLF